jgi:hypothetical protein
MLINRLFVILAMMVYLPFNVYAKSVVITHDKNLQASKWCEGAIEWYEVDQHGQLYVNGTWNGPGDTGQLICNVDGSWGGINASTCKAWVLTFQSAFFAKKHVKLKYLDLIKVNEGCETLGAWSAVGKAPDRIRVLNE